MKKELFQQFENRDKKSKIRSRKHCKTLLGIRLTSRFLAVIRRNRLNYPKTTSWLQKSGNRRKNIEWRVKCRRTKRFKIIYINN